MGHNSNDVFSSSTKVDFIIQHGPEMMVQEQVCANSEIILGLNVDKTRLFLVLLAIRTFSNAIGLALIVAKVALDQIRNGADSQVFGRLLCCDDAGGSISALQGRREDAREGRSIFCQVIAQSPSLFGSMVCEGRISSTSTVKKSD